MLFGLACLAYAGVAFLTWFVVAFYFGSQVNTLPVADRTSGWIVLLVSVTAGLLWPLAWVGWGGWRAVQYLRGGV